jgi:hypothetical protein
MSILIDLLIFFFISLIIYQIFLAYINVKEGLDNPVVVVDNTNHENDPMILSQKNAGSIEVLKDRLDNLEKKQMNIITGDIPDINNHLKTLDSNYNTLNTKVDNLLETQSKYASLLTKPEITGTT